MAFTGVKIDKLSAKKDLKAEANENKAEEGVGGSQTSAGLQGREKCVKLFPINEARAAAVEFPIVSWSKSTVGKKNKKKH